MVRQCPRGPHPPTNPTGPVGPVTDGESGSVGQVDSVGAADRGDEPFGLGPNPRRASVLWRKGFDPGRPEIITICGSMRCYPLMLEAASALTARGVIVLAPHVVAAPGQRTGWSAGPFLKDGLDELHRRKIALSDRVLVVTDLSGYYGESTEREIAFAAAIGVPVAFRRVTIPAEFPDRGRPAVAVGGRR